MARPTPATVARQPAWRAPVGRRLVALTGSKSWDLYADVYAPAWDEMMETGGTPNDGIALVVNFVETITDHELEPGDRALVAKLVRAHGKAALYGLREAMGRTNEETGRDWFRYASRVARTTVARIRSEEGQ